jgi:hypothetical protein
LNVVEYRVIELRYKTFIACNAVSTQWWNFLADDWFKGDDRNFSYAGATSRSFQSYYITVGPTMQDGPILDVAKQEYFGSSIAYNHHPLNTVPCPAGQVCPSFCATCIVPGVAHECVATATSGVGGDLLSASSLRVDDSLIQFDLDLVGYVACGMILIDPPAIDAHIRFEIRQIYDPETGVLGSMDWRIPAPGTGEDWWHDEFPWHELYLNGAQVYTFDPCIHPGGPDPGLLGDDNFGDDSDINLPADNQDGEAHLEDWREVP